MKKPYSFDDAQKDALKGGPKPNPGKISPTTVDWVMANILTTPTERAYQVQQMLVNSRLEGIEPDQVDMKLHQAYIAGTATLEDLHNHALAYALEHRKDNGEAAQAHLAAGRPISYYNDDVFPDQLLREWPDGRMEAIYVEKDGSIIVLRKLPGKSEMRKRRDAIRTAFANVRLSGFEPSKKIKELAEMHATGQITLEEFLNGQGLDPSGPS